eukprot:CAMPEP_0198264354 /NCGR_PEP_ID=MMETSP1447-20131203/15346_1 /TAXON_ID=420782 /ORGANISM="Chaetoceros dichaeta, Strain CCMP1751" /LENGTH=156 /DNA_ID=CAMNT_0043953251 /DNA_START=121 /DNA_END=587 /DNA_ORIENTATION=+
MPSGKGSKLLRYVEHRLRVTLSDSRVITGTFLAFDKHLNLVLSDSEEFRTLRSSASGGRNRANVVEERQEKRHLGLIILRGENVVSLAVEGPPPPSATGRMGMPPGGPGMSVGAGRGIANMNMGGGPPPVGGGVAPVGLGAAPVHGVGGAGRGVMG